MINPAWIESRVFFSFVK